MRDFEARYTPEGRNLDFSASSRCRRGGAPEGGAGLRERRFPLGGTQLTLHRYGFAPEILATDPSALAW